MLGNANYEFGTCERRLVIRRPYGPEIRLPLNPKTGHHRPGQPCRFCAIITGLLIHDFPVRVLADHLAIAERIEVTTLDLLSRALAGGACEGPS